MFSVVRSCLNAVRTAPKLKAVVPLLFAYVNLFNLTGILFLLRSNISSLSSGMVADIVLPDARDLSFLFILISKFTSNSGIVPEFILNAGNTALTGEFGFV